MTPEVWLPLFDWITMASLDGLTCPFECEIDSYSMVPLGDSLDDS